MVEIKNTVTKMKNVSKKRISGLEGMSVETSQIKD